MSEEELTYEEWGPEEEEEFEEKLESKESEIPKPNPQWQSSTLKQKLALLKEIWTEENKGLASLETSLLEELNPYIYPGVSSLEPELAKLEPCEEDIIGTGFEEKEFPHLVRIRAEKALECYRPSDIYRALLAEAKEGKFPTSPWSRLPFRETDLEAIRDLYCEEEKLEPCTAPALMPYTRAKERKILEESERVAREMQEEEEGEAGVYAAPTPISTGMGAGGMGGMGIGMAPTGELSEEEVEFLIRSGTFG